MVGVAISDVGLVANGDLSGDLVTDIIVAAHLGDFDGDVGVQLVELDDVLIENCTQVGTHGVVEADSDGASVIATLGNGEVAGGGVAAAVALAASGEQAQAHNDSQKQCCNFLHWIDFLPFFLPIVYVRGKEPCLLTLDTAAADTGHDVFPQEQEHQEQRCRNDGNSRHLHRIVDITGGIGEGIS